jgi:uncharacterized protein (DUF433 family)
VDGAGEAELDFDIGRFFRGQAEEALWKIECTQERFVERDPLLSRIALDPRIMVGQPVVRGTRLTVSFILGRLAHGSAVEELLSEYGGLTREDVQACLLWRAPL